jgi:hypothetical protein
MGDEKRVLDEILRGVEVSRQRERVGEQPPVVEPHLGFKSPGVHARSPDGGSLKRHSNPLSRLRFGPRM